ncbi:hypothetical protein OOJ74_07365 [Venenivibrio stagnispumantis]|nr:hypothetical protein [Venenivibrio stagnispumantis]
MIKIINYVKINNMKKIYSYIFSLSLCFNIAYAEDIVHYFYKTYIKL